MIKKIKKKIESNKLLTITYKILKGIFTAFLLCALLLIIMQKVSDNNIAIGGIRIFSVASESMKDEYAIGDIIITKKVGPTEINVGDNVTYLGNKFEMAGLVVTHKVVSRRKEDGTYYYITKGTANEIEDPEITFDQIYGKVIYKSILFGFVGRAITNIYIYYGVFTVIGLFASYQIVKIIFEEKEEEDADGKEEEKQDD